MDAVTIQVLGPSDAAVLERVADDVFDGPVDPRWCAEFMADQRHHLAVALDDGLVVGMISALHYVHPDKAPQLWINEVGVAPSHQRRGIGRRLMAAMLGHGRALGCAEAWLGTEEDNVAARSLYAAVRGKATPMVVFEFDLTALDAPPHAPREEHIN